MELRRGQHAVDGERDEAPTLLGRRHAALQHVFWQTEGLQPIDERGEGRELGTCASSATPEKPLRFNSA